MVSDVRSQSSSPRGVRARGHGPDSLGTRSQSLLLRASPHGAQLVKVLRTQCSAHQESALAPMRRINARAPTIAPVPRRCSPPNHRWPPSPGNLLRAAPPARPE
jgi:hypothetical protein